MESEKICLASKTIDISEHENYIELTNRLCYYDAENLNHVMLPYKNVEEDALRMSQTLVNMPIQAKYKKINDKDDLGGHEMTVTSDGDVVFLTESIGTHTSAWISEPEEVVTVSGETKKLPCLYATARVWKRNPNVVSAIKRLYESENGLNSSWEISTNSYEYLHGTKKLTDYEFIGNTFLGSNVVPAYKGTSKAITMTSELSEQELIIAEALSQDIMSDESLNKENQAKEDKMAEEIKKDANSVDSVVVEPETPDAEKPTDVDKENETNPVIPPVEPEPEQTPDHEAESEPDPEPGPDVSDTSACEPKDETAEKTDDKDDKDEPDDIDDDEKEKAARKKKCAESESTISELNDKIAELEKSISEKDEIILRSSQEITNLKSDISELTPYKEKFEKAEQEKIDAEQAEKREALLSSIVSSGVITREEIETSEELSGYIQNLDKKSLMALVGERLTASIAEASKATEVASAKSGTRISTTLTSETDDDASKANTFRRMFLG